MRKLTTYEVAKRLGISRRNTFAVMLHRHPELRPAEQLEPSGLLLWGEEDIQRVQDYLNRKRRTKKA
jgi:hypothetical protein